MFANDIDVSQCVHTPDNREGRRMPQLKTGASHNCGGTVEDVMTIVQPSPLVTTRGSLGPPRIRIARWKKTSIERAVFKESRWRCNGLGRNTPCRFRSGPFCCSFCQVWALFRWEKSCIHLYVYTCNIYTYKHQPTESEREREREREREK